MRETAASASNRAPARILGCPGSTMTTATASNSPTVRDVAFDAGVSVPTVYSMLRFGQIRGISRTTAGRYQLPEDAVEQVRAFYSGRFELQPA